MDSNNDSDNDVYKIPMKYNEYLLEKYSLLDGYPYEKGILKNALTNGRISGEIIRDVNTLIF